MNAYSATPSQRIGNRQGQIMTICSVVYAMSIATYFFTTGCSAEIESVGAETRKLTINTIAGLPDASENRALDIDAFIDASGRIHAALIMRARVGDGATVPRLWYWIEPDSQESSGTLIELESGVLPNVRLLDTTPSPTIIFSKHSYLIRLKREKDETKWLADTLLTIPPHLKLASFSAAIDGEESIHIPLILTQGRRSYFASDTFGLSPGVCVVSVGSRGEHHLKQVSVDTLLSASQSDPVIFEGFDRLYVVALLSRKGTRSTTTINDGQSNRREVTFVGPPSQYVVTAVRHSSDKWKIAEEESPITDGNGNPTHISNIVNIRWDTHPSVVLAASGFYLFPLKTTGTESSSRITGVSANLVGNGSNLSSATSKDNTVIAWLDSGADDRTDPSKILRGPAWPTNQVRVGLFGTFGVQAEVLATKRLTSDRSSSDCIVVAARDGDCAVLWGGFEKPGRDPRESNDPLKFFFTRVRLTPIGD